MELFGADLRALATLRIALGVVVLGDLTSRATDLYAHYTDYGVLPRPALIDGVLGRWAVSVNLISGEPFLQILLFCVAGSAALGLLVGYRTRLMTVLAWVLLVSIQLRNPIVNSSADALLRMVLFWGMFLPLGAYWSVDRARKHSAPRLSTRFLSMATVGLFMQIAFMYWFSALLKTGSEWRVDGTALYYTLSIDQLSTPIGAFLYQLPTLLNVLTFATLGLEVFGPLLLFFPLFTGPVRTVAVFVFMSLHFGIWLTLSLGIFPWIAAFCMVCFLPGWFWEKTAAKLSAWFSEQSSIERTVKRARVPSSFHARWLQLQERLSFAFTGVEHPTDEGRATNGHKTVAEQKMQRSNPAERNPVVLRSSLAANVLASLLLLYILFWNITTVSELKMPQALVPPSATLALDQKWGMFAPFPRTDDGWYVIPGTLQSGQQVDLMGVTRDDFSLQVVSWEKPQYVKGTFKNDRWWKYLENIWRPEQVHSDQRENFARYLCREWNARHTGNDQLTNFQIIYMLETTLPDYEYSTPEKKVLWEHNCF